MPWGVIDVRECGAAGDAQNDDTAAVLQAIERLPKSGGVLYFPPGDHAVNETSAHVPGAMYMWLCASPHETLIFSIQKPRHACR